MLTQEATAQFKTHGKQGLKLNFDTAKFQRPLLYAPLQAVWNLSKVNTLMVDVYAPPQVAEVLKLNFTLTAGTEKYRAPAQTLTPAWNTLHADLRGAWLLSRARGAANQIEWNFDAGGRKFAGRLIFDNFRAAAR